MTGSIAPRILLGVSGGIAAYKTAELVRRLRAEGAEVRVVMTRTAAAFIGPMTLQAVSGHPVRTELFDSEAEAGMDHIALARWADLVVIAPATADLIARLANGLADDLLTTLVLATEAPLALAPAMNHRMWAHPATCDNIRTLIARGVRLIGPDVGEQACGENGPGRMSEPVDIVRALLPRCDRPLQGVRVMLTAGPTREPVDPVRYVGNRSSGRMGFALAGALQRKGARVCLVAGPTALEPPAVAELVRVETALQMERVVMSRVAETDLFVAAAAVSDYRPEAPVGQKIKKGAPELVIRLVRNPDILSQVAAADGGPFVVGFAAETDRVEDYAREKLQRKGLDMIAANRVGGARGGFEDDENALLVLWPDGQASLPMMPKAQLAEQLSDLILERYTARGEL